MDVLELDEQRLPRQSPENPQGVFEPFPVLTRKFNVFTGEFLRLQQVALYAQVIAPVEADHW